MRSRSWQPRRPPRPRPSRSSVAAPSSSPGAAEANEQRAELARAQGPDAAEDRQPLHARSLIIASVDRHLHPRRHGLLRAPVPLPRGHERQPEADPRQHPARDRLDDRPRADPRGGRGADGRHDLRPRRGARAPTRSRSPSSASSGGGSSSTPTTRSSPPTSSSSRPTGRVSPSTLKACDAQTDVQRDPLLLGAGARGQAGRRARAATNTADDRGRRARHLPRAVRGVLRALARQHALPRDRADRRRLRRSGWPSQQQGPAQPAARGEGADEPGGPAQQLIASKYQCTNCHIFDDSSHGAATARTSRTSRAAPRSRAAYYELNRDEPRSTGSSTRPSHDPDGVGGLPAARRRRHRASACRRSPRTRRRACPTMTQSRGGDDRRLPAGADSDMTAVSPTPERSPKPARRGR